MNEISKQWLVKEKFLFIYEIKLLIKLKNGEYYISTRDDNFIKVDEKSALKMINTDLS